MKCPDCGAALAEVTQKKNWWLYRCFRCGGVLTNSETLNSLTHADLVSWRRVGVDPRWLAGGNDKSPMDGLRMEVYKGSEIPPELVVKRSVRTGVWWLPGDTIFKLKEAQGVKVNYYRIWGQGQATGLVLPVLVGMLLIGGLGVGVYLSNTPQRVATPAYYSDLVTVELQTMSSDSVRVVLLGGDVAGMVDYYPVDMPEQRYGLPIRVDESGEQYIEIYGLVSGVEYQLEVGGRKIGQFLAGEE